MQKTNFYYRKLTTKHRSHDPIHHQLFSINATLRVCTKYHENLTILFRVIMLTDFPYTNLNECFFLASEDPFSDPKIKVMIVLGLGFCHATPTVIASTL